MTSTDQLSPTTTEVRVAYAEVDKMGVVYYGHYLRWFELGRSEYLRARGKSYKEVEADGFLLPVVEASARYRQPARYDDLLEIRTIPILVGPVRVSFAYQVLRKSDQTLLTDGQTVHCCCRAGSPRPRRFPAELLALLSRDPV